MSNQSQTFIALNVNELNARFQNFKSELLKEFEELLNQKSRLEEPQNKVLTAVQASKFIGIPISSIYQLTSRREIPHFKRGRKLYFNAIEIEAWLLSTKVKSIEELEEEAKVISKKKK